MRAHLIVDSDPLIEIALQRSDARIDLLAERDAIELLEHGAVEALDNAVGLWALRLGAGVIDVLDGEIECRSFDLI